MFWSRNFSTTWYGKFIGKNQSPLVACENGHHHVVATRSVSNLVISDEVELAIFMLLNGLNDGFATAFRTETRGEQGLPPLQNSVFVKNTRH